MSALVCERVQRGLSDLKLARVTEVLDQLAEDASRQQQTYLEFLDHLLTEEQAARHQRRVAMKTKLAHFPYTKTLEQFDFSFQPSIDKRRIRELATLRFVANGENLILLGSPEVGKTHLAIGLALAACRQGHKVRFFTAARLVNELIQAQDTHRLHSFIASALKWNLLVLDELGLIPFTAAGAQLLFTFCSELYERMALIVTTNLKFADWMQVFGDERLTAALIDRLTHRAHILDLVGESHRFRQRLEREARS